MRVPRVAPDTTTCQPTALPATNPEPNPTGELADVFPAGPRVACGRARTRSPARADADARAVREWSQGPGELTRLSLAHRDGGSWADRREGTRVHGLVLSDQEREHARRLDAAVRQCGSSWKAWRGFEDRASGPVDLRLIAQTHCGVRWCDKCGEAIRRYQMAKCSGDWRLFFTFTIPRCTGTVAEAWRMVHGYLRTFLRELRRISNDRKRRPRAKSHDKWIDGMISRALARDTMRGPSKLTYAWAIEPHADGYPHVHMVVNQDWLDYARTRALWSASCGVLDANVDGRRVTAPDGICRYLAKYISKSRLSLDILAIIKGRRTWWSTLKHVKRGPARWIQEDRTTEKGCLKDLEISKDWGINEGWKLASGSPGSYALWERRASISNCIPVEVSNEEDEKDTSTNPEGMEAGQLLVILNIIEMALSAIARDETAYSKDRANMREGG